MKRPRFPLRPSPFTLGWAWIALLLIAYALRLHHLDFESFWTDEASALFESQRVTEDPRLFLQPGENAAPFLFVLGAWARMAGESDYALRYLALVFGLPVIPLTYAIGRRLTGRVAAWGATILAAGSGFLIYYAQEARTYSFFGLTSVVALYCLARALARPRSMLWWGTYGLPAALMPFLHVFGALALVSQLVYLAGQLWHRMGRRALPFLLAVTAATLPLLAWRGSLLPDPTAGREEGIRLASRLLASATDELSFWVSFPGDAGATPDGSAPLGAVGLLVGAVGVIRLGRSGLWLAGALVLLPLLARGLLVEHQWLLRSPRYLIFAVPPFLLLLAAGAGWLGRGKRPAEAALVGGLVIVSLVPWWETHVGERRVREDWRGVVRAIEGTMKSGDIGLFADWQVRAAYGHYSRRDLDLLTVQAPAPVEPLLGPYLGSGRQLVAVSHFFGRALPVDDWLPERALKLQEVVRPPLALTRYSLEPFPRLEVPSIEHFSPAAFAANVSVLGFDQLPDEDGRRLSVALHWQARNLVPYPVLSSLLLEDKDGTVWAASHEVPTHGFYPATSWRPGQILRDEREISLLPGTPAGSYTLRLALRRADTQEVLPLLGPDGSPAGALATLGPVTLAPSWGGAKAPAGALPVEGRTDAGPRLEAVMLPDAGRRPGQVVPLTSFWRLGGPAADLRFTIELRASDGRTYGSPTIATLRTPTNTVAGQLLAHRSGFQLPVDLPPGPTGIELRLSSARGEPLPFSRGFLGASQPTLPLGSVEVLAGPEPAAIPAQATRVEEPWGDSISLAAFTMDPARGVPAGGSLTVTLYWSTSHTPDKSYTVFVHILGPSGRLVAQHDGPPAEGTAPTTGWVPGQTMADSHRLVLPPDIAPGTYSLLVGLYEPSSGKRLAGPGGAETATLGHIEVR